MSTPFSFLLFLKISIICFFVFLSATLTSAADPLNIVVNEIAWMGTKANSSDEWIELYNNTNQTISLEGWGLYEAGGETLIEPLTGIIEAKSYYLVERTDDTTISDIPASQEPSSWGGYGLKNSGEHLQLLDQNSTIIDEVNCSDGWFVGDNKTKQTMERKNPQLEGSDPNNWQTSQNAGGTPKAKNSIVVQAEPQPKPESEKPAAEEPTPSKELQESQTQKQLAAVGPQIPEPPKSLYIFLIALGLAISSGVFVLFLKKKQKNIGN